MIKSKLFCCCKTNKIKSYQHLAVAIKHNSREWMPANDNGTPSDVLIPYRSSEQAISDVKAYMPRKNAVLAIEYVLIASPEWFENKTEQQIAEWEKENLRFLEEKHGRDTIIGLCFHRGEQTIHGHAIVIPLDEKKRLNCRAILGGAKKMRELQDEYAKYMKTFGLQRGESKITPRAKEEKAYYQAVNRGVSYATKVRPVTPEQLPAPTVSDRLDPRKYATRLINRAIKEMQVRESFLRAGLETAEKDREQVARIAQQDRQRWKEMKDNPDMITKLKIALEKEIQARTKSQAEYKHLMSAIKDFFKHNISKRDSLRKPTKLGSLLDFPELRKDISISLSPNELTRQDMERTR